MQKFSKTLAIIGLMTPLTASALGIGAIKLNSTLNQRLNAEIALLVAADESLENLRVSLAPPEAFAKAGIERSFFLTGLRFEVLSKGRAVPTVRITSVDTVREPYVNFLVELQWAQGHALREFTLLLDPPSTFKERAIAARNAPQAKSLAVADAHASPESFNGAEYGPVRAGETLWSVTKVVNHDRDVSVEQMVVALYEANPQAFSKPNLFSFMSGAKLRVPSKEAALGHGVADAKKIIDEHHAIWRSKAADRSVPASPATATPPRQQQAVPAEEKALTLLAAGQASDTSGKKPTVSASRGELALEIADTVKQENEDIRTRLGGLEQQQRLMQRLLSLKDEQIAALQAGKPMPSAPAELSSPTPIPVPTVQPPLVTPAPEAVVKADSPALVKPVEPTPVVAEPAPAGETAKPAEPTASPPVVTEPPPAALPPTAAAAPAPAPQPPVTAPQPTIAIDELLDNSVGLFGGFAIVVVGLAFLAFQRRRNALAALDLEMRAPEIRPINVTQAAGSRSQESGSSSSLITPSQQGSFLRDFTPSDFDVLDSDNDAIDPISEADVYLAYGRFSQAEALIRQAINENPFRDECKLKLLEVFYTAQNREAFEKYVAELLEENKNSDHDFWARVVDMGGSLAPENPIFGGGKLPAAEPTPAQIADIAQAAPAESAAAELDNVDFSFDLDDEASLPVIDTPAASPSAAPASAPPANSAETEEWDPSIDFDAFGELEPPPISSAPTPEPAELSFNADSAAPSVEPPPREERGFGNSMLAEPSQKEVGLSFDLPDFRAEPEAPLVAKVSLEKNTGLAFDLSSSDKGGFSFAGISQTADEPATAVEEEPGRSLEFDVSVAPLFVAARGERGGKPLSAPAATTADKAAEEEISFDLSGFTGSAVTVEEEPGHSLEFDVSVAPQEPAAAETDKAVAELIAQTAKAAAELIAQTAEEEISFGLSDFAEPTATVKEEPGRSLEFDASAIPQEPAPKTDNTASGLVTQAVEEKISFDLSDFAEPAPPAVVPSKDDEFDFDMNFDLISKSLSGKSDEADLEQMVDIDTDELETRLDLARAYVDMDNVGAAKQMLEEVLRLGDARQQQEAQELMAKLG